ncbi:mandelate racemase/muconate lactonizing enzyme family protein [Pseudochelatococcus sp. B33]
MKIAKAETIALGIPFTHGAETAGFRGQNWSRIFITLIRLETDQGLVGWGDAFSYTCWGAVKSAFDSCIAPLVVGRNVGDIATFMREVAQPLHLFGQNGVMQYALSGLDIALWDLKAKAAGTPLRNLLGPGRHETVPGYASLFKYNDTDVVRDMCRRSLAMGFRSVKLHEMTVDNVRAAREVCGPATPLMVDVNCPWTPEEALQRANAFKEFDILWLEEPLYPPDDYPALAQLQSKSGVALAAGENACGAGEFSRMIEAGAVTFVQPSVTKVGGISAFLEVQALCEARNIQMKPHSPYFGPGFVATVHLAAAGTRTTLVEWFLLDLEASLFGDRMLPKGGNFELNPGPGLGEGPDPDVIHDYRLEVA